MIWDHAYLEFMTQAQMVFVLFATWLFFYAFVRLLNWRSPILDDPELVMGAFVATLIWGVILVLILFIDGVVIIYHLLG